MCVYQEKNLQGILKGKKTQYEETEQASEPDMRGMLELSDWGYKTIMIYMLRALIDKVDSIQEQMGIVSREMEIQRKYQKQMLEIKNFITEMKNVFDRLISRLDMAEEKNL